MDMKQYVVVVLVDDLFCRADGCLKMAIASSNSEQEVTLAAVDPLPDVVKLSVLLLGAANEQELADDAALVAVAGLNKLQRAAEGLIEPRQRVGRAIVVRRRRVEPGKNFLQQADPVVQISALVLALARLPRRRCDVADQREQRARRSDD